MTNEQLAEFIQSGEADDLKPILWQRVKKLMFKLCGEYYAKYNDRFKACGVELVDLRQEMYFAFLQAVKAYKRESGFAFVSFLQYPIRTKAAELLNIRNAEQINKKPLDNCCSLEDIVPGTDDLTIKDTIKDETAQEPFEQVLKQIADDHARKVITEALKKLSERERAVIVKEYFQNKTLSEIADILGISNARVSQIKAKALRRLRCMPALKILDIENTIDHKYHFDNRTNNYVYYRAAKKIRRILETGRYISYGHKQAIIYECRIQAEAERVLESDLTYQTFLAMSNDPEFSYYECLKNGELAEARKLCRSGDSFTE